MNHSTPETPVTFRRRYILGLLMLVGLVNYIDRLSMSILQIPIKAELGLSDTQLGALTGLAFSLVYTVMAIPIARLADTFSRKAVIVGALLTWSLMTAACGLAGGFVALVIFRMGVAIGEAGCAPASHSLLSDLYPFHHRGRAIATYGLVFPLGSLLGFAAGGWLGQALGWRETFMVLGAIGVALAPVVMLTIREPRRGESDRSSQGTEALTTRAAIAALWRFKSLRFLILGGSLLAFPLNAAIVWNAPFYNRVFGLPIGELAFYLALLSGGAGAIGLYAAGFIADRLGRTDPRWYMWVPGIAGLATPVFMVIQYHVADPYVSLAIGALPAMLMYAYLAPKLAIAQSLVGSNLRALVSATIVFASGLIGTVLAPLLTGMVSDWLIQTRGMGALSLRYAILSACPVGIAGALLMFRGARHLQHEFRRDPAPRP